MSSIEVLSPGALTTVQDWPGREGFWHVGVPPSGPMDDRSLRAANRLLGNPDGAPCLEVTLTGPRLRFTCACRAVVTGAPMSVELDGAPVAQWRALEVPAGGVLALGVIRSVGVRAYLAVSGGFDGPATMGSRSVFAAAALGGRPLRRGDTIPLGSLRAGERELAALPSLELERPRRLRIVLGPHGAPDFLTAKGLAELLAARWRVHHHSDRTGIRLVGPRPAWSRPDGGEAGLHPSNILDAPYSVGSVMLAGDTAVIVGPDGPSLGGFVAIGQVVGADRWLLGQLRAGDEVHFDAVEERSAARRAAFDVPREGAHGLVTCRRAGESAVLVEFGEESLDLRSRVRVHQLQQALQSERVAGLRAITAGVRSLQVQYDPDRVSPAAVLDTLARVERQLADPCDLVIASRTVRLPLSWRHSEVLRAVERYRVSVRADAPWCPDNIDFIRRINGLAEEQDVLDIVLSARYLVLGLGDVYLGAPVAVPLDPCHRLVTTKYNPARTWTPANAVGIGGVFLCVYGIEGPGGYQLVGRTVQMWHQSDDPPWRLRHFDQLCFEAVQEGELEELRAASAAGGWLPPTEPAAFVLAEHERSLRQRSEAIARFRARREAAFAAERQAWLRKDETAVAAWA